MTEIGIIKNLIYHNQHSSKVEAAPSSNSVRGTRPDTPESGSGNHPGDNTLEKLSQVLSELVDQNKIEFHYDKTAGTLVVKVMDPDSGEVIRSIPPEYLLDMIRADDLELNGIIIDKMI